MFNEDRRKSLNNSNFKISNLLRRGNGNHASINIPALNSLHGLFEFSKSLINEDKLYEWIA